MLSTKLPYNLLLTQWASELNPLIANPLAGAVLLSGISLNMGVNTINHTLARKLQGYIVVMNSGDATFYDSQNINPTPQNTLILVASEPATVSLLVF
jgi:hypothetical protein